MTFVRIFGRWFVHVKDRGGVQSQEDGRWRISFQSACPRSVLRVNGRTQEMEKGVADVRGDSEELALVLQRHDGIEEPVERLVIIKGRLFPAPLDTDAMLLMLAERIQGLEARVDQEETDIKNINNKGRGALYLGGAKQ